MPELTLAAVRAALQRLPVRRRGLVVGLVGAPGSGKTWTARQLRQTLNVPSAEVHAVTPVSGVVAALPSGAARPAWVEGALRRLQAGSGAGQDTAELIAALLGAAAPFVLHVEDLHDAPPDTRAWWAHLAGLVARTPRAALLFTSRGALPEALAATPVPPLTTPEVSALLSAALGAPVPDAAARWVWAQTRGHPLFTREYLRVLAAQGALWNDGLSWHWRAPARALIPGSVEALILETLRAAPLSASARRAWQLGALLPPGTPAHLWQRAAQVPDGAWPDMLRELDGAGLTVRGEPAHPLYREVEAASLDPAERAVLADAAARALRDAAPLLASALVREARWPPGEATALLEAGAAAALDAGQPRAAAERLGWAAELASGPRRAALALRAAVAWRELDAARAERLAGEARLVWPDHLEATFVQAGALAQLGEDARAAALLAALPLPAPGAARGAWLAGQVAWLAGQHRYPALLDLWAVHADAQPFVTPDTWAQVARALEFTGNAPAGLNVLHRALRLGVPAGGQARGELLWARCRARYALGDLTGALADASALVDGSDARQAPGVRARALSGRATIRDTLGEYAAARADAQEALDLFAQLGAARDFAQQQTRLACLLLEYGEYDRAEALLQEGRAALRRADATHFLALSEMNLAYLALERGGPGPVGAAVRHAEAGVEAARRSGSPLVTAQTLGVAARARAAAGDGARALTLAQEGLRLLPNAGSHDAAWATWALGFALEASGDPQGALAAFQEAQAQLEGRALTVWAARLGLEADRLRADAVAARRKRERFAALELRNWVRVVDRYFPPGVPDTGLPGAPPEAAEGEVEVRVLGPLRIRRGRQLLAVRGARMRTLLLLLLDAQLSGEGVVSVLTLCDALYPQLPDAQAVAALHQLVYRARALLGAGTLLLDGDGYALGRGVRSDAAAFLAGGDTRGWAGLPDAPGRLTERLRTEALARLPDLLIRDPAEAARLGRLLLRLDPLDAEPLRVTVAALRMLGRTREEAGLRRELRATHAEVGLTWPP